MNHRHLVAERASSPAEAEGMIGQARHAARAREAGTALELLAGSGFLDGLVRRVRGAYSDLGVEGAEDIVAEGVARLYVRIADGGKPPLDTPDAYLLKSAFGLAKDWADESARERKALREHELVDHPHDGDSPSREVMRASALRVARSLLPRLGQENAQRVMAMLFDSVEELEPVSPTEIGEALDLAPNTVSKLVERGITRLKRVAREEGMEMSFADALAIEEEFVPSGAERWDDDVKGARDG